MTVNQYRQLGQAGEVRLVDQAGNQITVQVVDPQPAHQGAAPDAALGL